MSVPEVWTALKAPVLLLCDSLSQRTGCQTSSLLAAVPVPNKLSALYRRTSLPIPQVLSLARSNRYNASTLFDIWLLAFFHPQ